MEGNSNGSPANIRVPESSIRYLQSKIQLELQKFEKEIPETTFLESSVCDKVRNEILNFEDEPHLSITQNNCRRIFIASELFISICSIYSQIVDYEFAQIISDMVQWEKYRKISKKISYKIHLQMKREKYFAKEAECRLLKSLEDEESRTDVAEDRLRPDHLDHPEEHTPSKSTEHIVPASRLKYDTVIVEGFVESTDQMPKPGEGTEAEFMARFEKGLPSRSDLIETTGEESYVQVINETLEDSTSNIRKLSEIREDPAMDTSKLQYPMPTTPRLDLSLPHTVDEISIREPSIQQKTDDEINQILHILEEQISEKHVAEIEQPEHTLEPSDKVTEAPKGAPLEEGEQQGDVPEVPEVPEKFGSEEWSLPSLEPTEKGRQRRGHLIIDELTIIPNYAGRALQLNRNINVERIQVYEGPPKVLKAISANYLMTTPGFKSSPFHDLRSSKLSKLYSRHLEVEKRPVEIGVPQRRTIEKQREVDITKERKDIEITERFGMRSLFEKSDILIEEQFEKSRQEDLGYSAAGVDIRGSIIGMPVSRIIKETIEPPTEAQMERINAAQIFPTSQQLQGKSIDPKTSSPWFLCTKENPPDAKYREFNYVYQKLQNYWSLFESQGMEKCITLREFLSFEQDKNNANFLTLLRVVDKMSIQRKLLLEYKNPDVLIRPFESPYLSDKQLLLKGDLIF